MPKLSTLEFKEGMNITQAIEESGGLQRDKKNLNVLLYRFNLETNDRQVTKYLLADIRKGKNENFLLQPYDIIEILFPRKKRSVECDFRLSAKSLKDV